MDSTNGHRPAERPLAHPLRFVFFGNSIVSDWHNPVATTARAVLRSLVRMGHDAIFLEERQNRPTVELLRARGAGPLRAYSARYPDVRYRTYELPAGRERLVWLGRELSTADAVVVLEGAPAGVVADLVATASSHLARFAQTGDEATLTILGSNSPMAPLDGSHSAETVAFGPAIERLPLVDASWRTGVLLVAYDDQATAEVARAALAGFEITAVSAGAVAGTGWPFVPEVDLPEQYRRARVAVVVGAGTRPYAAARALLPVAVHCPTVIVGEAPTGLATVPTVARTSVAELADRVAMLLQGAMPSLDLPDEFDANRHAARLVAAVRRTILAQLG